MLSVSYKNIFLYMLVKYFCFYLLLMFFQNNFWILKISEFKDLAEWVYLAFILLLLPVIVMLLCYWPIYFALKQKVFVRFLIIVFFCFVGEYFVYVYFTSQRHVDWYGILNVLMSIGFLALFFYKIIISRIKRNVK